MDVIGALTAGQVGNLHAQTIQQMDAETLAAIAPDQCPQLQDVGDIQPDAFSAMTTDHISALPAEAFQTMVIPCKLKALIHL